MALVGTVSHTSAGGLLPSPAVVALMALACVGERCVEGLFEVGCKAGHSVVFLGRLAWGELETAYGPEVSHCCMHGEYGCGAGKYQPPHRQLFLSPEQRFCRIAVGSGGEAVFLDADDFGFEKPDPLLQFVLRIRAEVFGGEFARGIASGAWTVIVIHRLAISQGCPVAVNGYERYCTAKVAVAPL